MLGLAFFITYFLSFEAMALAFTPGLVAFIGSTLGMTICVVVPPKEKEDV